MSQTHPPTEALRKQCYERATALLREERLNRSTRPTEGRESGQNRAEEIRRNCNLLTTEERELYFWGGMARIFGSK